MLSLTTIDAKWFETCLEIRSLTFECYEPTSRYYGKNIVIAHWSIEHDRQEKPAQNPCWDVFAKLLLAS